jgi:hypothetical protein
MSTHAIAGLSRGGRRKQDLKTLARETNWGPGSLSSAHGDASAAPSTVCILWAQRGRTQVEEVPLGLTPVYADRRLDVVATIGDFRAQRMGGPGWEAVLKNAMRRRAFASGDERSDPWSANVFRLALGEMQIERLFGDQTVLAALGDPQWKFRTITGLAHDTGMPVDEVGQALDRLVRTGRAREPLAPDKSGRKLFTAADRKPSLGERLRLLRRRLATW